MSDRQLNGRSLHCVDYGLATRVSSLESIRVTSVARYNIEIIEVRQNDC